MFQVRQLFSSIQSSIQVSNRFPQHVSSCAYLPQASSQQIRFLVGSSSSYHAAMAFMQAQGFKVAQCVLIHFCLSRSDPRMSASLLAPGSQLLQPGCRLLQLRLQRSADFVLRWLAVSANSPPQHPGPQREGQSRALGRPLTSRRDLRLLCPACAPSHTGDPRDPNAELP